MKKLFAYVEDLWVAVAFAEAGEYEARLNDKIDMSCQEDVRILSR